MSLKVEGPLGNNRKQETRPMDSLGHIYKFQMYIYINITINAKKQDNIIRGTALAVVASVWVLGADASCRSAALTFFRGLAPFSASRFNAISCIIDTNSNADKRE